MEINWIFCSVLPFPFHQADGPSCLQVFVILVQWNCQKFFWFLCFLLIAFCLGDSHLVPATRLGGRGEWMEVECWLISSWFPFLWTLVPSTSGPFSISSVPSKDFVVVVIFKFDNIFLAVHSASVGLPQAIPPLLEGEAPSQHLKICIYFYRGINHHFEVYNSMIFNISRLLNHHHFNFRTFFITPKPLYP